MLNKDYKEMLQLLSEEQVDFMIVGAYALGVHGYPRATGDIDIWVKPNDINSRKLYKALARFGAPLDQIKIDDFEFLVEIDKSTDDWSDDELILSDENDAVIKVIKLKEMEEQSIEGSDFVRVLLEKLDVNKPYSLIRDLKTEEDGELDPLFIDLIPAELEEEESEESTEQD